MSLNIRANIIPEKNTPNEKDYPLREDIRLLGRMLGDTIRELEGETMFNLVETIRQTSVRFRRDQDEAAEHELDTILNNLSHKDVQAPLPRMAVSRWLCNA